MAERLSREWTRAEMLKAIPNVAERQELAKTDLLIWCLEYEPLIRLPNTGDIPFSPYYAQQVILKDQSRWRLENKMRQGGFSTAFACVESVHSMLYKPNPDIIVLSKSEEEAVGFLEKFYLAYDSIKGKEPNWSPLTKRNTKKGANVRGGKIKVLTSSKGSGRSFSATDLYFDEMAHTQYAKEIYEASYPTISRTGGRITIFSSPLDKQGKFYELCDGVPDNGYSFHQFEWWFVPFYNPYYKEFLQAYLAGNLKEQQHWINKAKEGEWYKQTLNAIGDLAFAREYECSFDAGGDTVFNTRQIANVFRKNWLERSWDEYGEVWRDPAYELVAGKYVRKDNGAKVEAVTFTDYGRKRDPLVAVTMDIGEYPAKVVEYKRIRPIEFDFTSVKTSLLETIQRWGSDAEHDGTGNGDVLTAFLEGWSEARIIGNSGVSQIKTNMVEKLKIACDTKAIMIPRIKQIEKEFKAYKYNDKHMVQDCVMAIMGAVNMFFEPAEDMGRVDKNFSFIGDSI